MKRLLLLTCMLMIDLNFFGSIAVADEIEAEIQNMMNKDHNVALKAANTLVKMGKKATPALLKALGHGNPRMRMNAAYALTHIKDPDAVDALNDAMQDKVADVRVNVSEALLFLGHEKSTGYLIYALINDSNYFVRENAARSLGRIGHSAAVPFLIEALYDPETRVRIGASLALGRLKDPSTVYALIDVLEDKSDYVRENSLKSLKAITKKSFGNDAEKWRAWYASQK